MMKCPLCGFEFEAQAMTCTPACPLKGACHFVCCPRCGSQIVDADQATSVKVLQWWKRKVGQLAGNKGQAPNG